MFLLYIYLKYIQEAYQGKQKLQTRLEAAENNIFVSTIRKPSLILNMKYNAVFGRSNVPRYMIEILTISLMYLSRDSLLLFRTHSFHALYCILAFMFMVLVVGLLETPFFLLGSKQKNMFAFSSNVRNSTQMNLRVSRGNAQTQTKRTRQ